MRKLLAALFTLILILPNYGQAAADVRIEEAQLAFVLPDAWDATVLSPNRNQSKMDASDPLFLLWRRASVIDKNGHAVSAGINVTTFNVPPDANVVLASSSLMHRRNWPFKQFLSASQDGLALPNSLGYLTEFSPQKGVLMKLFVVHAINEGKFVEITLSSTEHVFAQVESEFRSVIRSLRMSK